MSVQRELSPNQVRLRVAGFTAALLGAIGLGAAIEAIGTHDAASSKPTTPVTVPVVTNSDTGEVYKPKKLNDTTIPCDVTISVDAGSKKSSDELLIFHKKSGSFTEPQHPVTFKLDLASDTENVIRADSEAQRSDGSYSDGGPFRFDLLDIQKSNDDYGGVRVQEVEDVGYASEKTITQNQPLAEGYPIEGRIGILDYTIATTKAGQVVVKAYCNDSFIDAQNGWDMKTYTAGFTTSTTLPILVETK